MSGKDKVQIGLAVAEMVIEHGLPAALKILSTLDKDQMTLEEIKALGDRVPHPDTFEGE